MRVIKLPTLTTVTIKNYCLPPIFSQTAVLSKMDFIQIFKHEQNPRQQITAHLFFSSDKVIQYLLKKQNCRQFTDTKKKNREESGPVFLWVGLSH